MSTSDSSSTVPTERTGFRFNPRSVVVVAGIAFWLGMMLVNTGAGGVLALKNACLLLLEFILLSSVSRTIDIRLVLRLFLVGGAMMGVSWILARIFMASVHDPREILTSIVIPIEEETLKLTPVLLLLWSWRKVRLWSLGATDLLLMGLAVGAGFELVEDAYIFYHFHASLAHGGNHAFAWLPTVVIEGTHTIAGHAIWTGLAAGVIGIVLLRCGRMIWWALALAGPIWSMLDHITNNLRNHYHGPETRLLLGLTLDGSASVYLFVLLSLGAVAFDVYVRNVTRLPDAKLKFDISSLAGLKRTWAFLVDRRATAYLFFRFSHTRST